MQRKYLILMVFSGLIIALDQVTKIYIHTHFKLHESLPVIQNFFNITYVRNKGAAFGMLHDSHETFRTIFFLAIPPLAAIIILFLLRGIKNSQTIYIYAYSAIFAGAIGNYIDRLRLGYVVDFLDFHIYNRFTWPAFNIADSAIVVGVITLMILTFFEEKQKKKQKKS
ncbi:MAG: signal peptidase II [Bdellovibrio sp.]|nr:MAG: signal peptidase II [Bdellovibrio sp.]